MSGGPTGARDGTLTIMCGGDEAEYNRQLPLMSTMGSNIFYFGQSGSGSAAKLVNQCLVTAHAQAAAEAIHMAESLDLIDLGKLENNDCSDEVKCVNLEREKRLIKMLSASWGQSRVLELLLNDYVTAKTSLGEPAASRPSDMFPPSGAPLRNLHKDMQCAMSDLGEVLSSRPRVHQESATSDDCFGRVHVSDEFPVFTKSASQVAIACSGKSETGLRDLSSGPFLSLIELLRPPPPNPHMTKRPSQ